MDNKILVFTVFSVISVAMLASAASAETLTIRPDGQGRYAQWRNVGCGSGSNEWQCVDEDPASTSDYLYIPHRKRKETFRQNLIMRWFSFILYIYVIT